MRFACSMLLIVFALIGASCTNMQNQASADVPAATPGYPASSLFPDGSTSTSEGGYPSSPESSGTESNSSSPSSSESSIAEPFVLRDGERLVSYQAQKGDNLWKLAQNYKTSVKRIQSANGLTNSTILAGKTYKIPTRMSSDPVVKKADPQPSPSVVSAPPEPPASPPAPVSKPSPSSSSFSAMPNPTSSFSPGSSTSGNRSVFGAGNVVAPADTSSSGPPTFSPRDFEYSSSNRPSVNNNPSQYGVNTPGRTSSSVSIAPASDSTDSSATPAFGAGSF